MQKRILGNRFPSVFSSETRIIICIFQSIHIRRLVENGSKSLQEDVEASFAIILSQLREILSPLRQQRILC